jgi:hypothetical protein
MNLSKLFEEVQTELTRAREKHPVNAKYLLHPETDPTVSQLENSLVWRRKDNDTAESMGEHSHFAIIGEECREIFTAKTKEERHIEIVQAIATLVRLDEDEEI